MYLLLLVLFILVETIIYYSKIYNTYRRHGVNHFTPIPLLGNMAKIVFRKEHMTDLLTRTYHNFPEDRFVINFEFTNPQVIIRDIELMKQVAIKDFDYFIDHRVVVNDKIDPFFGRSLFSLKGNEWKHMRSTLSPAFTTSKIRLMVPFMEEIGDQMIKYLEDQIRASKTGYADVDVRDLMGRYSNDVIASCAFGMKVDSQTDTKNQFYEMAKDASSLKLRKSFIYFASNAFPSLMEKLKLPVFSPKTQKFFKGLMSKMMKDRETHNIIRHDMIHFLIEAKKGQLSHDEKTKDIDVGFAAVNESAVGKEVNKMEWSEDDLIAQTLIFLLGGIETASTTNVFALAELASNPQVQERLAKEVRENNKKNNGKFNFNDLQELVYLDMFVSELLRKWSPGYMQDRICTKDYNLGRPNKYASEEFTIRKGESVLIPTWAIHYNPDFFPDPEKFDPERFSEQNKHKIKNMTYIPFGVGPRNCIASRFAICEIKALIYQTLLRLELSPCEKTPVPIQLSSSGVTLGIEGGHWFRFIVRQQD